MTVKITLKAVIRMPVEYVGDGIDICGCMEYVIHRTEGPLAERIKVKTAEVPEHGTTCDLDKDHDVLDKLKLLTLNELIYGKSTCRIGDKQKKELKAVSNPA